MKVVTPAAAAALDEGSLQRVRGLDAQDQVCELGLYRDSPRRKSMRDLLEASAATGASVTVEYFKKDFSPRVMRCRVCPGEDRTRRYVTVWDVEAGGYRRICLDNVVRVTVEALI